MDAEKVQGRGLTLIELAVVLAVTFIATLGVMWSVETADRRVLQSASEALQADFRYAQRMAMIEGYPWGIQFMGDFYRVFPSDSKISDDEMITVKPENGVIIMPVIPSTVLYYPRGTVSASFTVTLHKGRYMQQLTALVSTGRMEIKNIVALN